MPSKDQFLILRVIHKNLRSIKINNRLVEVKNVKHHLERLHNHVDTLLPIGRLAFPQKQNWSNTVPCLLLRENQFVLLPFQYIVQYLIGKFVFSVKQDKNKSRKQEQNQ